MADFGAPVASQVQVNPNQAVQTISGLLGLQQQKANIQTAQAQAQQQTLQAQSQTGLARFYQTMNPVDYVGPDGTFDVSKILASPQFQAAAGVNWPQATQQLMAIKGTQINNRQSLVNLDNSTRDQLFQQLGGLLNNPNVLADNAAGRQSVDQAFDAFGSLNPEAARVAEIYRPMVDHAPKGGLASSVKVLQIQGMSAANQASAQQGSYYQTGAGGVQVNPSAPGATIRPPSYIASAVPPGAVTTTDQYGNLIWYNPQNPGVTHLVGYGGPGPNAPAGNSTQGAGQSTPSANSGGYTPPVYGAGTAQNVQAQGAMDQKVYSSDISLGNQAPALKNALNSIVTLSKQVPTGTGSEYLSNVETVMGQYIPGLSGAATDAAKRQMIGKYYEQVAMQLTASNFGTDAARDMVGHALPNPSNMTPQALQEASKYIATQEMISQAKGNFARLYYQQHGGSTVGYQNAASQFIQQTVDPRIFDYEQLNPNQRSAWINKTFGDNTQAKLDFGRKLGTLKNLSGYNYGAQ